MLLYKLWDFSQANVSKVDFEGKIAYGIGSSYNKIVIVVNTFSENKSTILQV
jgi:hypothetical protein